MLFAFLWNPVEKGGQPNFGKHAQIKKMMQGSGKVPHTGDYALYGACFPFQRKPQTNKHSVFDLTPAPPPSKFFV